MSTFTVNGVQLGTSEILQKRLEILAKFAESSSLRGHTIIVYDNLTIKRLSPFKRFFWVICCCSCFRRILFGTDVDASKDILIKLHKNVVTNPILFPLYLRAVRGYNALIPGNYIWLNTSGAPELPRSKSGVRKISNIITKRSGIENRSSKALQGLSSHPLKRASQPNHRLYALPKLPKHSDKTKGKT
jgi:hypothetical protein